MIRVYLDWNVMAQMKDGHLDDLYAILCQKDRFFIPYSTSHIGDLLPSQNDDNELQRLRVIKDLDFISSITQNYCLYNSGSQIILNTNDPHSMYDDRMHDEDVVSSNYKCRKMVNKNARFCALLFSDL
jgi:hypothetical protein